MENKYSALKDLLSIIKEYEKLLTTEEFGAILIEVLRMQSAKSGMSPAEILMGLTVLSYRI